MAGLLHDVGVQGQALESRGLEVFGVVGNLFNVDGIGLVSRGLLWPKGAIWGACDAGVSTAWTACGSAIATTWTNSGSAISTTWTNCV
jgi:hypothetical protein